MKFLGRKWIKSNFITSYKILKNKLLLSIMQVNKWIPDDLNELIAGKCTIIKHKSVLTDMEKEYLSNIIKPFRDSVVTIAKRNCYGDCAYFIQIKVIQNKCPEYINLPYFEKGRMYRGMEANKDYTLEELGL